MTTSQEAENPRTVVAKEVSLPADVPEFWNIAIGPDFAPVILWQTDESGKQPRPWDDDAGVVHTAVWLRVTLPVRITLPLRSGWFHFAQPLSEDEWLFANARNYETPANASVFDVGGNERRAFALGDGIEDCQTTDEGRIWVSYFDEGVFGDPGPNNYGLACFDRTGNVDFLFAPSRLQVQTALPGIDDCYALNVASRRDVWLYYYSDFPLVSLLDLKLHRMWPKLWERAEIAGSHAFAVAGEMVLFVGGYRAKDRLFRISLRTEQAEEVVPVDAGGERIAFERAVARGSKLYVRSGEGLFVIDAWSG